MKSMLPLLTLLSLVQVCSAGTIAPALQDRLDGMASGETVKVLVVLHDQPDVAALDADLAQRRLSRSERHRAVVSTLQQTARTSQRDLLAALAIDKSGGGILGYTPHWIVNAVVVTGTPAAIRGLAARADVRIIEPDLVAEIIAPVMTKTAAAPDKDAQGLVVPGVLAIGAERVWHELGITGEGAVVANMDSGVDGTHPALSARWRGNFVATASAWRDHAGFGVPDTPTDFAGHGTHVMGTITGATAFDTLGVAPGARWIATNAINGTPATFDNNVIAGFEWIADPDGNPNTSDDVPDVCHNSWGVNPTTGYLACDSTWWDVIDNCEAAGVVVTFSAGNEGPAPGSLRSPGDRASSATNCFTIGSTAINPPHTVSTFSSRGPSLCGGPDAIKPEVMAPGDNIYSCMPGGSYGYMSGTSMAGPHVAGVVALMRSAAPDLDVTTIKEILMATALDLGQAGEDNDYGHGLVDAYAAVAAVLGNVGTVSGIVTAADSGLPLAGVAVRDLRGAALTETATDGTFSMVLLSGDVPLRFSGFGYTPDETSAALPGGGAVVADANLVPMPPAVVSGVVRGPDGSPLAAALVTALATPVPPVSTDANGQYALALPGGGSAAYELLVTAPGYAYDLRQIGLQGDRTLDFDLPHIRADGFETGDLTTLPWQTSGNLPFTVAADEAHEGIRSARSGAIGANQASELVLDFHFRSRDTFSFWYRVDSEPSYDTLELVVDGVTRSTWSGNVAWTRHELELAAGDHEIRWVYSKDASASVGADAAWIDLVTLPGTGVRPEPRLETSTIVVTATVDAGGSGSEDLLLTNTGSAALEYAVSPVIDEPGVPDWLQAAPADGVIHPTSTAPVAVTFTPGYMGAGLHVGQLRITSNDPLLPETTVVVALTVNAVSAVREDLPRTTVLHGAAPNPFNPATEIGFGLPRPGRAVLAVYDVAGRLVRRLQDGHLPAGHHRIAWDGCDARGRHVASGIYYARLLAGGESLIEPMALVR